MLRVPKIIAHRGASAYAPENTLAAIQAAADMGIEWVEMDVKLTADDVPVIMHDDDLLRTCGMDALVKDVPYSVLAELDAGSWFGDSFIGEKVPTLEEAVDLLIRNNMGLNLELKPCPGREVETAQVVLDHLTRLWDDHDRIIISSFSAVCLETAADMLQGDWAIGYLFDDAPENWREMAAHLGAKAIHLNGNHESLTRELIEDMIDEGYPILAWTINNPMKARELVSWGVDGVFSDEPDIIRDEVFRIH